MADPTQLQPEQNAESPRMLALKNLAKNLPVANSQVAAGQAAARGMQLQQAVAAAPASTNTTGVAQQIGAQQAQQAGAQQVEAAQKTTAIRGPLARIGTAANQESSEQGQQKVAGLQQGAKQQEMDNVQKLASLSEDAKKQLYDDQMQFQKDEQGRTMLNTMQLLDYNKLKAQNDEQYKNNVQAAQQVQQRSMQAMDTAYKKVLEDLNQKYAVAEQQKDQRAMKQIAQMRADAQAAQERDQNRAKNNAAAMQAGVTVAATVASAVI